MSRTASRMLAMPRAWMAAFLGLPSATRLLGGAALALLVALARPSWPLPSDTWTHVVVVDITQSMNTVDMSIEGESVGRLEFTRRALRQAVAAMPCGSRVGFGVFTEYRSLVLMEPVETCANYGDLSAVIGRIDGRMAWAGVSEVSKGVFSAVREMRAMPGKPSLLFITDGHEAPPMRPGVKPRFEEAGDDVVGTLLGVGGDAPSPIPKLDPEGHPIGFWQADEVMQADSLSLGRTAEGARQTLVDENGQPLKVYEGSGSEHLSSLKEPHLREVAEVARLGYRRLVEPADLGAALRDPRLARRGTVSWDLRALPLGIALILLAASFLPAMNARFARRPTAKLSTSVQPTR